VIAGDHLDADAGRAAFGDRGHRLLARGVDEPEQRQHGQPLADVGDAQVAVIASG